MWTPTYLFCWDTIRPIAVHACVCVCTWLRSGISGSWLWKCFLEWLWRFCSTPPPSSNVQSPYWSPFSTTLHITTLLNCRQSSACETVSPCGLTLLSSAAVWLGFSYVQGSCVFLLLWRASSCLLPIILLLAFFSLVNGWRFFSEEGFHWGRWEKKKIKGEVRSSFLALNFENSSTQLLLQGKDRKPFQALSLFLESPGPGSNQNLGC